MALTSSFGFTNKSEATDKIAHIAMRTKTDYSLNEDGPDRCVVSNKTTPIDQPELVTYQCGEIKKVPTSIDVVNPAANTAGVQYGVRVDEVLRVTSTTNDSFIEDFPIVMNITVKHPRCGMITSAQIDGVFQRLIGALVKADGTTRFNDLMRSALKPDEN